MRLLYFAWLRTRIGRGAEEFSLPPGVCDVAGLLALLQSRGGRYAEALSELSVVKVAVNQDYVGHDHRLRDGDEVALFPPVTGG
jgi:sulfur-carrier protein